jgi:hypothetical protein
MADYQLTTVGAAILRNIDGAYIPVDPGNADYAAYLAWEAEGNTPDSAPIPPRRSTRAISCCGSRRPNRAQSSN